MEHLSDHRLIAAVLAQLTPPKQDQTSSFQLHAPLELLARAALLPQVAPPSRDAARRKLVELGARYSGHGEAAELAPRAFDGPGAAGSALEAGLRAGDPQLADAALRWLLGHEPLDATRARLRPLLVDHLGAAAHAPILLAELPRVSDRMPGAGALLRAPLHSVCKHRVHLGWHRRSARPPRAAPAAALIARLAAPPSVATAGHSIAPTMLAVEGAGLAEELLGDLWRGLSTAEAERTLSRVAAWSMLQESTEHAPYGWTHALTLPQAMLRMTEGTDDAAAGVAVAMTYALGFRATLGQVRLDPAHPVEALEDLAARWQEVATAAAVHTDAHFAKYVVACQDAAARDPDAAHLYLCAARRLASFWAAR